MRTEIIPQLMIGETGTPLVDAYSTYGIKMADGFMDSLYAPFEMKGGVSNEIRITNGKKVLFPMENGKEVHYVDDRDVSLTFRLLADSSKNGYEAQKDLIDKRNTFYQFLMKQRISICLRKEPGTPVFRLIYTGKSARHSMNLARTACLLTLKFTEENPLDRLPREEDGI